MRPHFRSPKSKFLAGLVGICANARRRGAGRFRSVEVLECRTVPATITVTSLADNFATDGLVTLREAIEAANNDASVDGSTKGDGADTIEFIPSLFANGDGTIGLMHYDTGLDPGEAGPSAFTISTEITILGPAVQTPVGTNGLTISRNSTVNFRLFTVMTTGNLTLDSLTIANGAAFGFEGGGGGNGGGGSAGMGGAVFVRQNGTLNIRNSLLTGNVAQGGAGTLNPNFAGGGGAGLGANGTSVSNGSTVSVPGGGPGGGPVNPTTGTSFGQGGAGGNSDQYSPQPFINGAPGGFGAGGGGGGFFFSQWSSGHTYSIGGNGGFGGGAGGGQANPGVPGYGGGVGAFGPAGITPLWREGGGGAGMGGAVFSQGGTVTITNSTLAGNTAQAAPFSNSAGESAASALGGAVFALNGSLSIVNSTISGNILGGQLRQSGRGVFVRGDTSYSPGTASVVLSNSIIAQGDTTFTDVVLNGTATASGSGNLIGSGIGLSSGMIVSSANPLLSPLVDNGGPTKTFGLLAGSPALDSGVNAAAAGLSDDQRGAGFSRILNGTVDIGAFEGLYDNPPVAQNNTVSTIQNHVRTFSVADFTYTDVENDPLASITILGVTLATGDTLTVNLGNGPVALASGMTISAAQIPSINYTPANNQYSNGRGTIQFTVNDTGPAYGTVAATVTINSTLAPGAPTGLALSSTSVNQRQPIGALVGSFQTTTTDPTNTFTYSLVQGDGDDLNWAFIINGDLLLAAASFDTRYITSLAIRVRTTDSHGYYFEQPFSISVTSGQPTPTYRAYNPTIDSHFFTTNQAEFQAAIANGYLDETSDSSGFELLNAPDPNATEVYRLYNISTGQHYYTTNRRERDFLVAIVPLPASGPDTRVLGWRDEGITAYLFTSQQPNTLPIFQLYNSNSGTHLYTESTATRDAVLAIPGAAGQPSPWSLQGILGYGYPSGSSGQPSTPSSTPPTSPAVTSSAESAALVEVPALSTALNGNGSGVGHGNSVNLGLVAAWPSMVVPPPHAAFAKADSASEEPVSSGMVVAAPTVDLDLVLRDWMDSLHPITGISETV